MLNRDDTWSRLNIPDLFNLPPAVGAMVNGLRLTRSGCGILRLVVLAAAAMARFPRGDGGRGALAMAGSNAIRARFAVALRCVWDLGWTGRGTPAPVAPPKRLVVVGFYRYVRNPMYVGFAVGWIGLWIVFGHANAVAIAAVAAAALSVHLFVVFYEEPTLRKKFGAEYEEYCRNVNRWWPRMRGWDGGWDKPFPEPQKHLR